MGQVEPEKGFLFYTDIGKPLNQAAFSLKDFINQLMVVPLESIEFHQERGDFSRWIKNVLEEEEIARQINDIRAVGEDLRKQLIDKINERLKSAAECPECGFQTQPVKTWIMSRSKRGGVLEIRIGHYRCPNCKNIFRKRIA